MPAIHSVRLPRDFRILKILAALLVLFTIGLLPILYLQSEKIKNFYHETKSQIHIRNAKKAIAQNKLESARIFLTNAYRHKPNNPEILELYKSLVKKNDPQQHLGVLMQIYRENPSDEQNTIELIEALERFDLNQVIDYLIPEILKNLGHKPEILFRVSTHYAKTKKLNEAYKLIRHARKLNPKNLKYEAQELTYQIISADNTSRESLLKRLDEIRKMEDDYFLPISITLAEIISLNDLDKSVSILDEILARHPNNWKIQVQRSLYTFRSGRTSLENMIDNLWASAKNLDEKLHVIAISHANSSKEQTKHLLSRLDSREAGNKKTQLLLLMIDWENSHYEQVEKRAFDQMRLDHEPLDKILFTAWGLRVALNKGDKETIRSLTNTLRILSKNHPFATLQVATRISKWQTPEILLTLLEGISETNSERLVIISLQQMANIYQQKNDLINFRNTNKKILSLEPTNVLAAINYVRAAAHTSTEILEALTVAERFYQNNPNNPEIALAYAEILEKSGKTNLAQRIFLTINDKEFLENDYVTEFSTRLGIKTIISHEQN